MLQFEVQMCQQQGSKAKQTRQLHQFLRRATLGGIRIHDTLQCSTNWANRATRQVPCCQHCAWCTREMPCLKGELSFRQFYQGFKSSTCTHKIWLPSGIVSGVGGAGRGASLAEGIDVAAVEDSSDDSSVSQSSCMNQNTQTKANTKWYM